nr:hypothetical protein [Plantibacter sp. M259]
MAVDSFGASGSIRVVMSRPAAVNSAINASSRSSPGCGSVPREPAPASSLSLRRTSSRSPISPSTVRDARRIETSASFAFSGRDSRELDATPAFRLITEI